MSRFPEDINLYHSTLDKETFQAVIDGTTTQQHKNEAWLCAMASSQISQEQENKVLQQLTQTLKTVNIKESQEKDPCFKRVKEIIESNILLHHPNKAKEHPTVKRLLMERRKLNINSSNILVRKTTNAEQTIIPSS